MSRTALVPHPCLCVTPDGSIVSSPPLRACVSQEVHDDPNSSPVDGPTQWPLRHFKPLLEELLAIGKATKGKQEYKIDISPYP